MKVVQRVECGQRYLDKNGVRGQSRQMCRKKKRGHKEKDEDIMDKCTERERKCGR